MALSLRLLEFLQSKSGRSGRVQPASRALPTPQGFTGPINPTRGSCDTGTFPLAHPPQFPLAAGRGLSTECYT